MSGLFELISEIVEPMVGLGSWHGISPSLYGHNPDAPAIWSLTCHKCFHHGPPDCDETSIWCLLCGTVFWRDPAKSTGEAKLRRQAIPDATRKRLLSGTYHIRDLEALKAAYLEAKARHRERMATLMRSYRERETERPQPGAVGALSFQQ